jgi:signal transduction histidine kinase
MSHELRTPLNAMLGFAQLLRADAQKRLTPLEFSQLEHIHRAGWHLLALVNDVLDVSRIEAGNFEMRIRAVALHPILVAAAGTLEPLARKHGVTIDCPVEDATARPYVQADPLRLEQVFLNLISNAVKYNRPGGHVRIDVHTQGDRVDIDVADSGIGMSSEQLAHLFEPFNRLGHEHGGIEGTGLGLSLTRELVLQMKGELVFSSRTGEGTTAQVRLPRGTEPGDHTPAPRSLGAGPSRADPRGTVL